MRVKVYVVQKVETHRDDQGRPVEVDGKVVGAKLNRAAAQSIAKDHAPCRVTAHIASKDA